MEFFWSVFPRIRTEYVFRIQPEKTPYLDTFHAAKNYLKHITLSRYTTETY